MTVLHKKIIVSENKNSYGAVKIRHNKALSLLRSALK